LAGGSVVVGPKGYLIAPVQYDDSSAGYGVNTNGYSAYGSGYSTGFPSQSFYNPSAYPVYGR
jgi:hypothetical protein